MSSEPVIDVMYQAQLDMIDRLVEKIKKEDEPLAAIRELADLYSFMKKSDAQMQTTILQQLGHVKYVMSGNEKDVEHSVQYRMKNIEDKMRSIKNITTFVAVSIGGYIIASVLNLIFK